MSIIITPADQASLSTHAAVTAQHSDGHERADPESGEDSMNISDESTELHETREVTPRMDVTKRRNASGETKEVLVSFKQTEFEFEFENQTVGRTEDHQRYYILRFSQPEMELLVNEKRGQCEIELYHEWSIIDFVECMRAFVAFADRCPELIVEKWEI